MVWTPHGQPISGSLADVDLGNPINNSHPLAQGLVGFWLPLPSLSGGSKLYDLTRFRNHGSLTNMDPRTDWVNTERGIALDFDGGNDYVECNAIAQHFANGDDFTLSIGFRTTSTVISDGRENCAFSMHTASGSNVYRLTIPNGRIDSYEDVTASGQEIIGSQGDWNDGKWHYLTFSYPGSGTNERAVVDGRVMKEDFANNSTIAFNSVGLVQFGQEWDSTVPSDFFDGQLTAIAAHKRVLSVEEAQTLYAEFLRNFPTLLNRTRHYYPAVAATTGPPAFIPERIGLHPLSNLGSSA